MVPRQFPLFPDAFHSLPIKSLGKILVISYPDTSFLCALYLPQSTSLAAIAHNRRMKEPLYVTVFLLGVFRQSVRFQIFRNRRDPSVGFEAKTGLNALDRLQSNRDQGALVVAPAELAERISSQHTLANGHGYINILHVATALHLGARELLSCDLNQRRLAKAEGLTVNPLT